jgi:ABC-type uncharacterized transport system permease subunit
MSLSGKEIAVLAVASLLGVGAALLLAGPALFADGPMDERLTVVAMLSLFLGVVAFVGAALAPNIRNLLLLPLLLPVAVITIALVALEPGMLTVGLFILVGPTGFSLGGSKLGAFLRSQRGPPSADQSGGDR